MSLKKTFYSILSINAFFFSSLNSCSLTEENVSCVKNKESIQRENTRVLENVIQAFSNYEQEDFDALKALLLKSLDVQVTSSESDETFQGSSCKPERYIKKPMPQTQAQLEEPDIFKKFKITYTGNVPFEINMLISKINRLIKSDKKQNLVEKFDTSSLQNTSVINTLLLYGEPGNGKTYLVDELARALQVNTLFANGSLLQSSFRHQSATNIKKFFDYAKQQADPLIIFIDEIDPIAGKQVANNGNNSESTDNLKMLLDQLNEIKYKNNLFVIIGTNHLYWLEESFRSRFALAIEIERPKTEEEYKSFFKYSYTQYGIDNAAGESDQLAVRFYNESIGKTASKKEWPFSRRNLSYVIPFILVAKDTMSDCNGKTEPDSRKINIKDDAQAIDAAVEKVRKNYTAEHMEDPEAIKARVWQDKTRGWQEEDRVKDRLIVDLNILSLSNLSKDNPYARAYIKAALDKAAGYKL